jgi:hypothetical protein
MDGGSSETNGLTLKSPPLMPFSTALKIPYLLGAGYDRKLKYFLRHDKNESY